MELHVWFNKSCFIRDMASCEYGQIAGGTCGCSVDNPANVKSIVIAKCTKDIRGHLRSLNVRDASVRSESTLLLARAGMYVGDKTVSTGQENVLWSFSLLLAYNISSECRFRELSNNPNLGVVSSCKYILLPGGSVGFCWGSRVEGNMSRVEGNMSRVEGRGPRVNCLSSYEKIYTMNKIFSNEKNPDISLVFIW